MLFVKHEGSSQARFTISKCKWCGRMYIKVHNRQMYCSSTCKDEALKQQWRNASHEYYHKHKSEWGSVRRYGLGSGTLGPHANTDFELEKKTIEKELARLRIKR